MNVPGRRSATTKKKITIKSRRKTTTRKEQVKEFEEQKR